MPPPEQQVTVTVSPEDAPAWAIRLEAKVDIALAQHKQRLDDHAVDLGDHEGRLRALENKSTVSPSQLWTSVLSGLTAVSAAAAAINILIR